MVVLHSQMPHQSMLHAVHGAPYETKKDTWTGLFEGLDKELHKVTKCVEQAGDFDPEVVRIITFHRRSSLFAFRNPLRHITCSPKVMAKDMKMNIVYLIFKSNTHQIGMKASQLPENMECCFR